MVSPTILNPIKKLTKAVFILFLIGLVISSIVVWQIADSVVHPPRRDLQDYHHYWLQHSADEGISITHYNCASGKMPCISVKPQNNSTLGLKEQHIREQLKDDFGQNLPVLQFHGDADTLIDIEQGRQLFDSYSSADKIWIPVAGAEHNNVLVTKAPVYATMADWMLDHNVK